MKNPIKSSIRKAIILHFSEGMSYSQIAHQLRGFNVTKNQVQYTVKKFRESDSISGRPRSKRTPEVIQAVRQKIYRNPRRSMSKLAKEHCMSQASMWRMMDFGQRICGPLALQTLILWTSVFDPFWRARLGSKNTVQLTL